MSTATSFRVWARRGVGPRIAREGRRRAARATDGVAEVVSGDLTRERDQILGARRVAPGRKYHGAGR